MNRSDMENKNEMYLNAYEKIIEKLRDLTFDGADAFDVENIRYFKVEQLTLNLSENSAYIINEALKRMFLARWSIGCSFYYVLRYDGYKLSVYFGSDGDTDDLKHISLSAFPGSVLSDNVFRFEEIVNSELNYLGAFKGNPVVRTYSADAQNEFSPIDELLGGTSGIPWMLCVSSDPISSDDIRFERERWVNNVSTSSEFCNAQYSSAAGGAAETINTDKKYIGSESYNKMAERFLNVYDEALSVGQWRATATLYSDTMSNLRLVGNMFSASLRSGDDEIERPYPMMFYPQKCKFQPLSVYQVGDDASQFKITSLELAALCSLPTRDSAGFPISGRAEFDVSRTKDGDIEIGHVMSGGKITSSIYSLDSTSLNRHGLIIGLTGGGKTNTVKSLIYSINRLGLPFMVIEPAKKEYYELYRMGLTDLQVYAVGSLEGNLLKLNPFECMQGIPLQSHIDVVFSAFKASFILYSPMPYVLENAIYAIYRDYGWNVETGLNEQGRTDYPTIEDLYYKIAPVVQSMGYDSRMQNDLIGSLTARINSLRMGAKGRSLNVERSTPLRELLKGNVVIELDDIGDEDTKAFIISLILMQLQECRKSETVTHHLDVQHILLIEEAHRLLKNIKSGTGESADPRGAAVEYFCNMLAEIRSKGQGFLVIDQIPSKLSPDLVKNTNLKIVHRTVDSEDRLLIGGAMHMTDAQKEYLACLEQGVAAVYSEGDNRPKLVKLPYAGEYEKNSGLKSLPRKEILERTSKNCMSDESSFRFWNQSAVNRICAHCVNRKNCMLSQTYLIDVKRSLRMTETGRNKLIKILNSKNPYEVMENTKILAEQKMVVREGYTNPSDVRRCIVALWYDRKAKLAGYNSKSKIIEIALTGECI